jgi:multidrug efflux pump subunit AcrB
MNAAKILQERDLVVEYGRQRRAEGMEIVSAAVEGARLRLRPILMTSFAFILGVFPLSSRPAQAPGRGGRSACPSSAA